MKAIITKYINPTNTKSSRIKASIEGFSATVAYDYELSCSENHRAAMIALIKKVTMQDDSIVWVEGQLSSGEYVYTSFIPPFNVNEYSILNHLAFKVQ